MRLRAAAALVALFVAPLAAQAQDQSVVVVPPTPPAVAASPAPAPAPVTPVAQPPAPPPGLGSSTPVASAATQGVQPVVPDLAPTPPNTWQPGTTAVLGVLDEVDGSASQLSIPVGGQATAGDLNVQVQACVTRPAGQIPDAAVYVTVQSTSGQAPAPLYRGWMIRSMPGATVVGNAGETFRVISCS